MNVKLTVTKKTAFLFRACVSVLLTGVLIIDPSSVLLLANRNAHAQSAASAPDRVSEVIPLPGMLLEKRFDAGGGRELFLLRDLHCQEDAQLAIAEAIHHLHSRTGIRKVFLEGAEGPVETLFFRAFPDQKVRSRVGRQFLREGYLTGAEFAAIKLGVEQGLDLYGVEDAQLYLENFKVFRKSKKEYNRQKEEIAAVNKTLKEMQQQVFSPELYSLVEIKNSLCNGHLNIKGAVSEIHTVLGARGETLKKWSSLEQAHALFAIEAQIDKERTAAEQAILIGELETSLAPDELGLVVRNTLEYRLGKIGLKTYLHFLLQTYTECFPAAEKFEKSTRIFS